MTDANNYAVKFLDGDKTRIRGMVALFGDPEHPDLSHQRDYFTKQTNFYDANFPCPKPLAYHHGFDPATADAPFVGTITKVWDDDTAKWFEAQLDASHKYYEAICKLVENGALKTSSDSVPQDVHRTKQANGTNWLDKWAVVAVSLTPTPAEPRMYSVSELKAAYKSIGVALDLSEESVDETDSTEGRNRHTPALAGGARGKTQKDTEEKPSEGEEEMENQTNKPGLTVEEIAAISAKAVDDALKAREAEAKARTDAQAAIEKQVADGVKAGVDAELAKLAAGGGKMQFAAKGDDVHVYSKYDGVDRADLAFLAMLRNEAKTIGKSNGANEELLRALALKSWKDVEAGKLEAKALESLAIKTNEVMQSTLASYGDEWVFASVSSGLWQKIRDTSRLVAKIPQQEIPRGFESETIPLEGTDFTFYNVSQAATEDGTMKTVPATITSSKAGSGQRAITVGKLGARGEISGELDEDSIIDAIPEARRKLEAQLPMELEFLLLNMDSTAATDNINGNGTPTSGADYTLGLGMVRLALKTNTDNKKDMGTFDSDAIAALYSLLGENGLYVYENPKACMVVCDGKTWMTKLLNLSDLLTVGNAGQYATINAGLNADGGIPILGVPWYPSGGVKLAQATGIRHSATNAEDGSDTKGRCVLVRPDQWMLRWRRRAKFETVRIPESDTTRLVVTLRFGLGYRDTDACAVGYNI